jgi:hypothetical protein
MPSITLFGEIVGIIPVLATNEARDQPGIAIDRGRHTLGQLVG